VKQRVSWKWAKAKIGAVASKKKKCTNDLFALERSRVIIIKFIRLMVLFYCDTIQEGVVFETDNLFLRTILMC
jgi:hypothetical protein